MRALSIVALRPPSVCFGILLLLYAMFAADTQLLNAARSGNLKAGVAAVDITPPVGCIMSGYDVEGERYSTGIMHPLHAKTIVLSDSRNTIAIVTLDLLDLHANIVQEIRKRIWQATGIDEDHSMLSFSHTHAGPLDGKTYPFPDKNEPDPDMNYIQALLEKIPSCAALAMKNLQPVTLEYGEGLAHFNVNRRLWVDGKMEMLPNQKGIVDNRVRVLSFRSLQTKQPIAVVMHYVCHPNVMRDANTLLSGDYPSPAKAYVEDAFGSGCIALFMQGCSGDIRPNFTASDGQFGSGGKTDVERFGIILGKEVVRVCREEMEEVEKTDIQASVTQLSLPAKKGGTINSEMQAVRIGNFWLFTIPGEPMVELGMQIEMKIPGEVLVVGYANDTIGYLCTERCYAEGGYEPMESYVTKESEHIIISTAVNIYNAMIKNK